MTHLNTAQNPPTRVFRSPIDGLIEAVAARKVMIEIELPEEEAEE